MSVIAVNNVTLNSAPSNRLMRLSLATSSGFREDYLVIKRIIMILPTEERFYYRLQFDVLVT